MIFFLKKYAFGMTTVIVLLTVCFMPINDKIPENNHNFMESIRLAQLGFGLIFAIIFYLMFIITSGKFHNFYKKDKFYSHLMYFTILVGIISTIHYINWETTDVHNAVKVWEIAAYSVTLFYTLWLWTGSKNGKKILRIILINSGKENQLAFMTKIGLSLLLLVFITLGHLLITFSILQKIFNESIVEFIKSYSIQISIVLITITYYVFGHMSNRVIESTTEKLEEENLENVREQFNHEFSYALKYIDRPMKYVFVVMTIYAGYCTIVDLILEKHIMHDMEVFFGGAIAFELLLSSIVWANTESV